MLRVLPLLLLLLAPPANAQRAAGSGRTLEARVTADYAEVRAGPGAAYVSRGRVYGGDKLRVKQRSENGEWYEVVGAGVNGWVRARALEVGQGTAAPSNPGRDRKTTNYTHDADGRRIFLDGREMGSGEGTKGTRVRKRRARKRSGDDVMKLRVSLGAAQIKRTFESNIAIESALRDLSASATGFGYEFEAEYVPIPYVAVRALYRDTRFTDIQIPANEEFGFEAAVDIGTSAQQAELDVTGRFPIGQGWVGAHAGGHLLRHQYQETQPYAVFLTNSFIAAVAGAGVGWRFGPIEVGGRGGIFLPVSVSQSPQEGGDPEGFGFSAAAHLAWHLAPRFAVVGHWHFTRVRTDYKGESTHADTHGDQPEAYSVAQEIDAVHGGGLGVRWTPF